MTAQQRVAKYRANAFYKKQKTIEVRLSFDECAILDSLASKLGISRVLFVSTFLKKTIFESSYFLKDDKFFSSSS